MTESRNRPRSLVVAAFLSLILPGFGQLYNGQWNRGLGQFLLFSVSFLGCLGWLTMNVSPKYTFMVFAATLVLSGLIWVYSTVDALVMARRLREYQEAAWQTWPVYVGVFLFAYIAVFNSLIGYTRSNLMEPFRIPSASMEPNLIRGDFLFADKRVNCKGCRRELVHGDVALFLYPKNRNLVFIKRIVGLPGDRITISGTTVSRNKQTITTSSEQSGGSITTSERGRNGQYSVVWQKDSGNQRKFKVPPGHVFVLGDNRDRSRDSRHYGSVPIQDVIGIATHVWLSVTGDGGVVWNRLGQQIK